MDRSDEQPITSPGAAAAPSSSAADDPPALSFPSLTINGKLASLASESITMRANNKKATEDTYSALEDSTYEVLGDSAYLTSDDEDGRTESLASYEGHTPDDVSSIADTEDSYDSNAGAEQAVQEHDANNNESDTPQLEDIELVSGSGFTARADVRSLDSASSSSILSSEEAPEISCHGDDLQIQYVISRHTIPDIPEDLKFYDCSQISLTVKQPVASRPLALTRPFKILYLGDRNHHAQQRIMNKVASALAMKDQTWSASGSDDHGSSRMNVVKLSSFGGAEDSPDVELIASTGIELILDECTKIPEVADSGPDAGMVTLHLNDKESIYFHPPSAPGGVSGMSVKSSGSHYQEPDLAIVIHPAPRPTTEDGAGLLWSRNSLQSACAALNDHAVPILNIDVSPFLHETLPSFYDIREMLHLRVEGVRTGEKRSSILADRPVSLDTFLDLPAADLNRHIAYITGMYDDETDSKWDAANADSFFHEYRFKDSMTRPFSFQRLQDYVRPRDRDWRFAILQLVLTVIVGFGLHYFVYSPYSISATDMMMRDQDVTLSSTLSPITKPTEAIAITTSSSSMSLASPSSTPSLATPPSVKPGEAESKSLGSPAHAIPLGANESPEFKLHVMGDHHFVLTPPRNFAKLRRPPQLHITIQRDKDVVAYKLNSLIEGVHAVEVEREQAYGLLQVQLWTESKPIICQDFEVNFGSPWLKVNKWTYTVDQLSNLLKGDGVTVEQLKAISTHVSQGIQSSVENIGASTIALVEQAQQLKDTAIVSTQALAEKIEERRQQSLQRLQARRDRISQDVTKTANHIRAAAAGQAAGVVKSVKEDIQGLLEKAPSMRKSRAVRDARRNAQGLWKKVNQERTQRAKARDVPPPPPPQPPKRKEEKKVRGVMRKRLVGKMNRHKR